MSQEAVTSEQSESSQIFNTKILMVASAGFLGLLGIGASFFPKEILSFYGAGPGATAVLLVKVTGALYFGFAFMNWMARHKLIGGIYSRPVALGNFFHFALVAVTGLKYLVTGQVSNIILVGIVTYIIFAAGFGYVVFSRGKSCQ